jgi:hypothetical protein
MFRSRPKNEALHRDGESAPARHGRFALPRLKPFAARRGAAQESAAAPTFADLYFSQPMSQKFNDSSLERESAC